MKIKIPKKIEVLTFEFKVKEDVEHEGGSFSITDREIIIGTRYLKKNPSRTFEVICHEIMELVMCLTATRYDDFSVSNDYKFFMNHKEFEVNIAIFASVVKKFII